MTGGTFESLVMSADGSGVAYLRIPDSRRARSHVRDQVHLHLGVWKDDGPHVTAVGYQTARRSRAPLKVEQAATHRWQTGQMRDVIRDFLGPQLRVDDPTADPNRKGFVGRTHVDVQSPKEFFRDIGPAVGGDAFLQQRERERPVERASIHMAIAQHASDRLGRARLSRSGRSVDRDDGPL